jgi:membrane protein implicated in regulation of membrane protease activity
MSSNPLLDFSGWGVALQLSGAVVVIGFVIAALLSLSLGRGVVRARDTLPTNPAEEAVRVGETGAVLRSQPNADNSASPSAGIRNFSGLSESDGH